MKVKEEFIRSAMLLGEDRIDKLAAAKVAVFGVGGVGGYICEALARAGVGELHLFDNDVVSLSNINRQIVALHSTVGRPKVEVMKERILDINPDCKVVTNQIFYLPENADDFPLLDFDYVADAIDTVSAKIELAVRCAAAGVPLISAMGTGNKLDATRFTVTDLSKTSGCPLARVMRRELKARGITHLKVVYSTEEAKKPLSFSVEDGARIPPASLPYVPPLAGLILAGEIIRAIAEKE